MPSSTLNPPADAASREALGLAGFTNLDVVRNPNLGPKPYLARSSSTRPSASPTSWSTRAHPVLARHRVPERRLEFRVGKLSLPDFFDLNSIGTDSHLQFMNWTVDNNGAWDYAADTRGYTYGAVAEYLDHSLGRALRHRPDAHRRQRHRPRLEPPPRQRPELGVRAPQTAPGQLLPRRAQRYRRVLGFVNHANMGVYRTQNNSSPLRGQIHPGHHRTTRLQRTSSTASA